MSTTQSVPSVSTSSIARALRRLYSVRFAFAIVWAIALALTGAHITPVVAVLLVIYPLFDLAAAIVDVRSSRATGQAPALYVNMALSLLAAIGLAIAVPAGGASAALRVWGAWAITAGIVQLIVGIRRRALGGQWSMIISGAISVVAGISFFTLAGGSAPAVSGLAGYATLGGIFFLISALRLRRAAKAA